jgi:hypothetical protein
MKLAYVGIAIGFAAVPWLIASAADLKPALELRPKAALMAAVPHGSAPFVVASRDPDLHLAPQREAPQAQSNSSCNADREFCYDADSGHIVFKPARQFMPGLPGMTPENVSVKKDRIILRYSF